MTKLRDNLAITTLTILAAQYGGVSNSEVSGPEVETDPHAAPWKIRLYGANKDRRVARKKRAKKLRRR